MSPNESRHIYLAVSEMWPFFENSHRVIRCAVILELIKMFCIQIFRRLFINVIVFPSEYLNAEILVPSNEFKTNVQRFSGPMSYVLSVGPCVTPFSQDWAMLS